MQWPQPLGLFLHHTFTSNAKLGKDAYISMQQIKILDCDTMHMVAENATIEVSMVVREALNDDVLKL